MEASSTSAPVKFARCDFAVVAKPLSPSLFWLSKLSATTCASRRSPLLKVTPSRRAKTNRRPSFWTSQDVANQGTISPVSRFWSTSLS